MKKLRPVLIVEQIEPCLQFWIDRLGFKKATEVPDGDKLGLIILTKGSVELIYQTRLSVAKDAGVAVGQALLSRHGPISPGRDPISLYIQVEDLNSVIEALKGTEVILPKRNTSYREFGVREPGGNVVVFF